MPQGMLLGTNWVRSAKISRSTLYPRDQRQACFRALGEERPGHRDGSRLLQTLQTDLRWAGGWLLRQCCQLLAGLVGKLGSFCQFYRSCWRATASPSKAVKALMAVRRRDMARRS